MKKKVVFIEKSIPDYRSKLFVLLHDYLKEEGIDFHLVAGQMSGKEHLNEVFPEGDWVTKINNLYVYKDIHYAKVGNALKNTDMVILHPMNSALIMYKLLISRYLFSGPKLGFFGHGGNMNAGYKEGQLPLKEKMKNQIAKLPDWWFPYTDMSRRRILYDLKLGYPENQITVVNNAVDTTAFQDGVSAITEDQKQAVRKELNIPKDAPVGLFCGRFLEIKITYLAKALQLIKEAIPNFHMIIIGKGSEGDDLVEFANNTDWAHAIGAKYHDERYPFFATADILINPGYVGLAVLDAFASGLPLYSTECGNQSPEIEYLRNGENGYLTDNSPEALAEKIIDTIQQPDVLKRLSENALKTAQTTTMEATARNFVTGITQCLGVTKPAT